MMKKKFLSIAIAVMASMTLIACGSATQTQDSAPTESALSSSQEESSADTVSTTVEATATEEPEPTTDNDAVETGMSYTFLHDEWNLYKATFLSDTTIKIEKWYRFRSGEDGEPFEYDSDVAVIKTEDASNSFTWIDTAHTAFTINMLDSDNGNWEDECTAYFSIEDENATSLGSNVSETSSRYSYMHDQWNLYRAISLSNDVIKIEVWTRFNSGEDGDAFAYDHDVLITDPSDDSTDFTWLDDAHTAFSLTMQDTENTHWEGESNAMFAVESDDSLSLGSNVTETGTVYAYLNDKWNMYKAIPLSEDVIKIEDWTRFNAGEDGDPFQYEYTVKIFNITDGSTDFEWMDDEHSSFTITMQDTENSYWESESLVAFTPDTSE